MHKIVCFGEVLWDVFPNNTKKIGGAPLNVALRLSSFNHDVKMVSAIGKDDLGKDLLKYLKKHKISTDLIQQKKDYGTGEVAVALNEDGAASYTITYPKAWDKIVKLSAMADAVNYANAFIYGSLITRDGVSRKTLFELLDVSPYNVFDVNLRAPHYTKRTLITLMEKANFIKFNDDELFEICELYGSKFSNVENAVKFISNETNTKHICVTLGAKGAMLFYNSEIFYSKTYKVRVKDTVGAGDSFLASLISQLLQGNDKQQAINFASAVGALVASKEGANPKITLSEIEKFMG
ncbi:carbohydrate kinase [Seonamhaeicola algicola]|uniref:Carbohydrate kinase n=1 Tax=Seonamhaeicola algicola TaxID=1719036 RepID=A0A5C7AMP9_9FLAO|nr:carbohydrate kinase [Seonamhaeicola algicola]TXE10026.1 carbohydrate kinase [Seonamhaeicola algicola]